MYSKNNYLLFFTNRVTHFESGYTIEEVIIFYLSAFFYLFDWRYCFGKLS